LDTIRDLEHTKIVHIRNRSPEDGIFEVVLGVHPELLETTDVPVHVVGVRLDGAGGLWEGCHHADVPPQ
jgi:hypothetical protein